MKIISLARLLISVLLLAGPFTNISYALGSISVEAEDYANSIAASGHRWTLTAKANGIAAMSALPDSGALFSTAQITFSPMLSYQVMFPTSGIYYIWLRALGDSVSGEGIGAGNNDFYPFNASPYPGNFFSGRCLYNKADRK